MPQVDPATDTQRKIRIPAPDGGWRFTKEPCSECFVVVARSFGFQGAGYQSRGRKQPLPGQRTSCYGCGNQMVGASFPGGAEKSGHPDDLQARTERFEHLYPSSPRAEKSKSPELPRLLAFSRTQFAVPGQHSHQQDVRQWCLERGLDPTKLIVDPGTQDQVIVRVSSSEKSAGSGWAGWVDEGVVGVW